MALVLRAKPGINGPMRPPLRASRRFPRAHGKKGSPLGLGKALARQWLDSLAKRRVGVTCPVALGALQSSALYVLGIEECTASREAGPATRGRNPPI